eukprot:Gb_33149 [translate_table: standard]
MIFKKSKRSLENGKTLQPAKCHKLLHYNVCELAAAEENVQSKPFQQIFSTEYEKPILAEDGCRTYQQRVSIGQQAEDREKCKPVTSMGSSRGLSDPLVDSLIRMKNVAADTTGFLDKQGRGVCGEFEDAAEVDTLRSVLSVNAVELGSRGPKDMDAAKVSASSTSSENTLHNSKTLEQSSKELVHLKNNLLPSLVCESLGSCVAACPEDDRSGGDQSFSHCESSLDLDDYFVEHVHLKSVPIGPEFQAEIPPWRPSEETALVVASDNKSFQACQSIFISNEIKYTYGLLGTCVWPLLGSDCVLDNRSIGQGRSAYCSCPDQSSIECVKEHIKAGRLKLKMELGKAFYSWGFDDMGERVSEQWSREEQQTFWELVNMNLFSLNKNFWDHLTVAFPTRTKKELVSYYFNVFMLRRRCFQNRLDPENIDSDDDETELHDTEIEQSDRCLMIEEGDDSGSECYVLEDDDHDEVAAVDMPEESMGNKIILKFNSCEMENNTTDKLDVVFNKEDTDDAKGENMASLSSCLSQSNNCTDLKDNQQVLDESCLSYEWNHELKLSRLIGNCDIGPNIVQERRVQETENFDDCQKGGKQLDLHYGNELSHEDIKVNESSCNEEFLVDGDGFILEPCDSKLWDSALVKSLQKDVDRLVSTCGMINELFGDETRDGEQIQDTDN